MLNLAIVKHCEQKADKNQKKMMACLKACLTVLQLKLKL
jgi:hypothetical protein